MQIIWQWLKRFRFSRCVHFNEQCWVTLSGSLKRTPSLSMQPKFIMAHVLRAPLLVFEASVAGRKSPCASGQQ